MPRDRGNKDHYDRPSWSERDKNRGKRRDTSTPSAPRPGQEPDRYQQKKMDQKFESLFTDSKKETLLTKIREQVGKEGFTVAVDTFRAGYGLPEDFSLLQAIFEAHPDVTLRAEVFEALDAGIDKQAVSTQQVFKTRVKLLKMTGREPAIKKIAVRIAKARGY